MGSENLAGGKRLGENINGEPVEAGVGLEAARELASKSPFGGQEWVEQAWKTGRRCSTTGQSSPPVMKSWKAQPNRREKSAA